MHYPLEIRRIFREMEFYENPRVGFKGGQLFKEIKTLSEEEKGKNLIYENNCRDLVPPNCRVNREDERDKVMNSFPQKLFIRIVSI